MGRISEETTKGLVADRLREIDGYPAAQNVAMDGVTWFKEDSFKGTQSYGWLSDIFAAASKKQTMSGRGTPDFTITKDGSNTIVVIECKADVRHHSVHADVNDYKLSGYGSPNDTENYAINGALWYATFLNDRYDVVAIGVSGQNSEECRVTSFVLPQGGSIGDIEVLEDGCLNGCLTSISKYEKDIDIALRRFAETEDAVKRELRRYTLSCANFLRSNGIEDNSKAGFVSAIILGLTNHGSKLYKDTKKAIELKNAAKAKSLIGDPLGRNSVKMLKASLYGDGEKYDDDYIPGIWDIDRIPEGKRKSLKKFYDTLLAKDELSHAPKGGNRDFPYGDTVLSRCIYSLYENVIEVIERYNGIDVMGEFYTTFLRFTKGNAKEKGIVLTPKHIADLFCDIAEYYSDGKFDENTKIIDICCGTGLFLICALARIRKNIQMQKINDADKAAKYAKAQANSLIGVEKDPSMYALAYANMRFHGDGKSNLFNCSSLLIDSYAPVDDSGKTYIGESKAPLHEALRSFGDIDIAMINPPYSLDRKDISTDREYPAIARKKELEERLKKATKQISKLKKGSQIYGDDDKISQLEKDAQALRKDLSECEKELDKNRMREVIISKGQDELDFVAAMLHYLKPGGIGIAILPMSCAGNSGTKLRAELLKHHTLLACMTMPKNLFFDSHVGTATCIMVFKAHIKHDESKSVFFARWQDDGFRVIPHNGRKDAGSWNAIKAAWIEQMDGTAGRDEYTWLRKKVGIHDEVLAEAYIKTDYSRLSDADFEKVLKKYSLFRYMDEHGILEE